MPHPSSTYTHIALGGTFDRLHRGHQTFITTALNHAKKITIGITTDSMCMYKAYADTLQSYHQRVSELSSFIDQHTNRRIDIVSLSDIFGPTLSDASLDALTITPHSQAGATLINQYRKRRHLSQLDIVKAPLVTDSHGQPISSTNIRAGLINRSGDHYQDLFNRAHVISPAFKRHLSDPHGEVITDPKIAQVEWLHTHKKVAVGDFATNWLIAHDLTPDYAIIDQQSQRKPFYHHQKNLRYTNIYSISNHPGHLTKNAASLLLQATKMPQALIVVRGEEDLFSLIALLLMPLGTTIFYGQPGEGLVIMRVTETKKESLAQKLKHDQS